MTKEEYKKYKEFIEKVSSIEIKNQFEDGSFFHGNNGPHGDEETPVRNTAYWLYTLSWLVNKGFEEYREYAERAAGYLLSNKARPMKAAFWCRKNPEKDFSNGLIGQAWVIECLIYASKVLSRQDLMNLAIEVHSMHKWNEDARAWHTLNVDGSYGSINGTFNQQIWFAAVGSIAEEYAIGKQLAIKYLDTVEKNLKLYSDGVIFHDSASRVFKIRNFRSLARILVDCKRLLKLSSQRKRSVGYHAFNLVAFKYLQTVFPEHLFWNSKKFKMISEAYSRKSFTEDLENNEFSYSYNPVGYEYGFFLHGEIHHIAEMINTQEKVLAIDSAKIMVNRSSDSSTTKSRLYELCRMLNEET